MSTTSPWHSQAARPRDPARGAQAGDHPPDVCLCTRSRLPGDAGDSTHGLRSNGVSAANWRELLDRPSSPLVRDVTQSSGQGELS